MSLVDLRRLFSASSSPHLWLSFPLEDDMEAMFVLCLRPPPPEGDAETPKLLVVSQPTVGTKVLLTLPPFRRDPEKLGSSKSADVSTADSKFSEATEWKFIEDALPKLVLENWQTVLKRCQESARQTCDGSKSLNNVKFTSIQV